VIEPEINKLASMIDLERDHQKSAVLWALTRFLEGNQCGVILADEVGCGKTYEALAVLALLWHHYLNTEKPIRRVLIICKSSLLRKWYEELTVQPNKEKHGIRSYLTDGCWDNFNEMFIKNVHLIENLSRAKGLWSGRVGSLLHGTIEDNKIQVPDGLYFSKSIPTL